MKVLHLTLSYSHGGRREAIAALANGLQGMNVASHLCCVDEFGSAPTERAPFVDSICLERRKLFDFGALRRLHRYCRDNAIDVLHAHDAASEAMSAMAMPRNGPVLLMSFHRTRNLETARLRHRLRNAIVGLRVGAVVTASEERRRHYIENNYVNAGKVSCIPLGIDLDRFRPDPAMRATTRARLGIGPDQLLVGTVGHFGPEKGVDLAIGAFQDFLRKHPERDARLVILGRGDPEHLAAVHGAVTPEFADRIDFQGFQTDPENWFPAFDVLLHGARDEAFGLVLAEAQACGVPVVAARVGGIPEVVIDGQTGRLATAPAIEPLAAMLEDVVADESRRATLARQAIEHAHHQFSRARYAHDFLTVYRRLQDRSR